MSDTTTARSTADASPANEASTGEQLVAEDLIEEVSIDGMCGVY